MSAFSWSTHLWILLFIKIRYISACAGIQQKSAEINMTFIYSVLDAATLEFGCNCRAVRIATYMEGGVAVVFGNVKR